MQNEKLLNYALESLRKGISVIPVGKNKIPLISWKEFQTRYATEEEVRGWFNQFDDPQVGFVTGKISNLTVVDVEKFGDPSFLPQETTIVSTGGDGYHYFYKFEEGINNKARIKELVDIRGIGGYVVSPNSVSDKGEYTLLQDKPLLPFPKDLFPEKVDIFTTPESKDGSFKFNNGEVDSYPGYAKGQRNDEMTRYIGHVLAKTHPADWDTKGWAIIERANLSNNPALTPKELSKTFNSINDIERRNHPLGRSQGNFEPFRGMSGSSSYREEPNIIPDDGDDEIMHIADAAEAQKINPDDIYPLGFEIFDEAILGGVCPGDVITIGGQPGHGKQLHIDTPILTPNGWKKNGDISIGDILFGKNGKQTKVIGAHKIEVGKSYKIEFNDGTSVIADHNHLWTVQSQKQRRTTKNWVVLTTKEIFDRGLYFNKKTSYKWFLPIVDPVVFSKKKLPIKPYTFGVLLANGSLSSSTVNITTNDEYIANKVVLESKEFDISEYICKNQTARRWTFKKFHQILQKIKLDKVKSREKFIPKQYLFSSVEDRISLLRGLMDCDGSVVKNKRAIYSSVSIKLAEGVATLVRSLGGIASIKKEKRKKGRNGYNVNLWLPINPFFLERKKENYLPKKWFKAIKSITPHNDCKMRCLTVDNTDGLYIISDFTVTHNTSLCQDFTINMLRSDKAPKALWFSYEVLATHLWTKFKEMGMTREDCAFIPVKHSTGNIEWVEKKIKEGKEKFDTKLVFIDHLGFLLPKTKGTLGKNMSSNYSTFLTQIMRDLKSIAIKEEVIIFLPVHMKKPNFASKSSEIEDISGSNGPAQESDLVFIIDRIKETDKTRNRMFTGETKISLAKNRKTGISLRASFNMLAGRFAHDPSAGEADKEFENVGKEIDKKEAEEKKENPEPEVVKVVKKENDLVDVVQESWKETMG